MYKYHRISSTIDFLTLIKCLIDHASYRNLDDRIRKRFMELYGFDDFVLVDLGRHALYLALWHTDRMRSEVITPAFSYPIISTVIKKAHKTPIYADVDTHSFSIDFQDGRRKITKHPAGVIVVHEFGNPVSMEGPNPSFR